MSNTEFVTAIQPLIDKMNADPSNAALAYDVLADIAKLTDEAAVGLLEPDEKLNSYLFLGDHYYLFKHYNFALEWYERALKVLVLMEKVNDENLLKGVETSFINILDIYGKMKKKREAKILTNFIKEVMPDSFDAIKKVKRYRTLKCDPVEYTEAYMKILPELEAKIDAELEGVVRGHGFCYQYWSAKKKILKRDYNIKWDSPGVLNPTVRFD